ncbi:MAG TPA: biotin--[acetyl-CoA-carboxylase] ligase [Candidatus Angelobacter sp.]|nr:biotin--[acetyl-CoA-carboxylase] ligase [Candidatus Angelobacter sp.]
MTSETGTKAMQTEDTLSAEALAPLVRNTIFSGNIQCFSQVASTNALALEAAGEFFAGHEGSAEGAAFLADEQTAGRGRAGHSWHSERGTGIYASFLHRPPMSPADALWLSLLAAVAVQDAVRETTGLQADIRWPNDMLLHEKKFSGILTEMSSEATRVQHAVIGIGINVNQRSLPADLETPGTSLLLETGKEWPRLELAGALIRAVDREYRALVRAMSGPIRTPTLRFEPLMKRVESRSSYARGKQVHVDEDGGYTGVTDGLDPRGFLRVRTGKGLRIVVSGSVRPLAGRNDAAGS